MKNEYYETFLDVVFRVDQETSDCDFEYSIVVGARCDLLRNG